MMGRIEKALGRYWGYDSFRPLQKEAMECLASGRDSIVVLPTGGGKSLCYQAPAVAMDGVAIVVSPLISLMKDQIDGLRECGVEAERIDSSLSFAEHQGVMARLRAAELKLLYVSPERLASDGFVDVLRDVKISFIAIDEAHCVSMWGHDFRPEYRQLGRLKQIFKNVTIGAYTATATEHVRRDIADQLSLKEPQMLTGSFDRPNLIFKVSRRANIERQVCELIERHEGESGIIYCIRRRDVEQMCEKLAKRGYKVAPYHAGMSPVARKKNQDMFIQEKVDIIVATVAFGMGIDKSNVRYVIHTGMPKSLEHYQQESGRGGRDGLEAECKLFYSGVDYGLWKSLCRDMPPEAHEIAMAKLGDMYRYCTSLACRHRTIVGYFGQELESDDCGACDICLDEIECMEDSLATAKGILECVVQLGERFGVSYTALVLTGSRDKRILQYGHEMSPNYGLLRPQSKTTVQDWIGQLGGQGYLKKVGEYNVLNLTEKGWAVLRGEGTPRLMKPAETGLQKPARKKKTKVSKVASDSWEGVDKELFEELRRLRSKLAGTKNVPAYVVFGDAALRDMARKRPSTPEAFLEVKGVGDKKRRQYGKTVLAVIREFCEVHSLEMDV